MKTGPRRSALSYIPGYSSNAVLQVIIFSCVAYVALALTWAIIRIVYPDDSNFYVYFVPLVGLPTAQHFINHFWTLITYGWFLYPGKFWELISNMLWVYCFGSVVQFLVGYKQVIPLYIYSMVAGGAFYLLGQLLPGIAAIPGNYLLGPGAGVMGLATASVTLSPQYRFYLTEYFSVPILLVAGIFVFLLVIGTGFYIPGLLLLLAGGLTGFCYVKLLQSGYRPGIWMYRLTGKIEGLVTPHETMVANTTKSKRNAILSKEFNAGNQVTQKRIDDILDKINQKGYGSLSEQEKEILKKAAQEK